MRRVLTSAITMAFVLTCASLHAAEPKTIEELKATFESKATENLTFTSDYSIEMDMAAMAGDGAVPPGMTNMTMSGAMKVKGDVSLMTMEMSMPAGDQAMLVKMKMHLDGTMMHMLMDMNGMVQAMKMDMSVLQGLAEELGVPESALNGGNMGFGLMANPAKMLDQYEEMYDLTLEGKETLNGEEVYVLSASIKDEYMENFSKNPMVAQQAGMFKDGQKIYIGAEDGIMRKMTMGSFMTMTMSNLDLKAKVTDEDVALVIPDGIQVMDMTPMMQQMFGGTN